MTYLSSLKKLTHFRCYQDEYYGLKRKIQKVKKGNRNSFEFEKDAINHYEESYIIAKNRHAIIASKLSELMADENFDIEYEIDGDTHGIEVQYQYINIVVNHYDFRFILE